MLTLPHPPKTAAPFAGAAVFISIIYYRVRSATFIRPDASMAYTVIRFPFSRMASGRRIAPSPGAVRSKRKCLWAVVA